jgi:polyisoprenoid-binding protein YceI
MQKYMAPVAAAFTCALALAPAARAQAVQSGVYALEPNHTQVLFGVSHMGFSTYYGAFSGVSGALTLDGANPAASSLRVSVPTGSVATLNATLTGELKSADWLDAAAYPEMTFTSTKVTLTGADTADVAGDLTLHGVTRPVVLKAKLNRGGVNPMSKAYTIGFEVSGHLKRSDFGVTKYVPLIGDDVELIISAPFERKPS